MINFNSALYKAWKEFSKEEIEKGVENSQFVRNDDWEYGKPYISTLDMFRGFLKVQGIESKVGHQAVPGMDNIWSAGVCFSVPRKNHVLDTFDIRPAGESSVQLIKVDINHEWVEQQKTEAEAAEKQAEADSLWDAWVAYRNKNRRNPDFIGVFGFSETTCFAAFAEEHGYEAGYAKLNGEYGLPHWIFCPQSGDVNPKKYHIAFYQEGRYESKWYLMTKELGEIFGLSDGKIIRL